jgi:soluble lytic murein transglycosylase-like protein
MLGWSGVGKPQAKLGLLAILLAPRAASAELYSFVDDEGVIHLTNIPKGREYKPYRSEEAEAFGGQKPVVIVYKAGDERVAYPVDVSRFDGELKEAAQHYNLPFAFLKAIAKVESNFNPRAISDKNAKGLMQLIDATAADMNVSDPFDPKQNIFGGARYLRILANEFGGNMALTAAAYNAGPERVKRLGRVPDIRETQRYVRRVLMMYRHYKRSE